MNLLGEGVHGLSVKVKRSARSDSQSRGQRMIEQKKNGPGGLHGHTHTANSVKISIKGKGTGGRSRIAANAGRQLRRRDRSGKVGAKVRRSFVPPAAPGAGASHKTREDKSRGEESNDLTEGR